MITNIGVLCDQIHSTKILFVLPQVRRILFPVLFFLDDQLVENLVRCGKIMGILVADGNYDRTFEDA